MGADHVSVAARESTLASQQEKAPRESTLGSQQERSASNVWRRCVLRCLVCGVCRSGASSRRRWCGRWRSTWSTPSSSPSPTPTARPSAPPSKPTSPLPPFPSSPLPPLLAPFSSLPRSPLSQRSLNTLLHLSAHASQREAPALTGWAPRASCVWAARRGRGAGGPTARQRSQPGRRSSP
eukprot:3574866-Rhodomonas_salina.1